MQKFEDLVVWQRAHQLVLDVYQETRRFPTQERYGLVVQMRRAAISVPANIVEPHGHARGTLHDAPRGANIPPTGPLKHSRRGPRPWPGPDGGVESQGDKPVLIL